MDKNFEDLTKYEQLIVQEYWDEIDKSESISNILDKFIFEGGISAFLEDCLSNIGIDIPEWVYIDYEKTWDHSLSYDFIKTSNYIFLNL